DLVRSSTPQPQDCPSCSFADSVVRLHLEKSVDGSGNVTVRFQHMGSPGAWTPWLGYPSTTFITNTKDFFTPYRIYWHNRADFDLWSSSPLIVPGSNAVIQGGKEGLLYVLSQADLGGYNRDPNTPEGSPPPEWGPADYANLSFTPSVPCDNGFTGNHNYSED